jgi:Flp pilus assembly protein TadG
MKRALEPGRRRRRHTQETRLERGMAIVEYLMLFPLLILVVELIVVGGRVAATHADVQSAAREAARQASISRGPGSAAGVIDPTADASLQNKGVRCQSHDAAFGPGTNFVPGGAVSVEVTCVVSLSDIDLLKAPGTVTVKRTASEPIEKYRVVE